MKFVLWWAIELLQTFNCNGLWAAAHDSSIQWHEVNSIGDSGEFIPI